MNTRFEDIEIADLDVRKTTWSRVHGAMRTLHLKLSREPDVAWTRFFFEERGTRVELKRHGLWIEEGYIIFDCLLVDVDSHHLPDIRASMAFANRKSRELVEMWHAEGEQERAEAQHEQRMLSALRASIRGEEVSSPETPEPAPPEAFKFIPPPPAELSSPSPADEAAQVTETQAVATDESSSEPVTMAPAIAQDPTHAGTAGADVPAEDTLLADFHVRRKDWRTRFRDAFALASRKKEPDRGND